MTKPFQIFSDGKEMAILMGDAVYVLRDPCIRGVTVNIDRPTVEFASWDGVYSVHREHVVGLSSCDLQLDIVGGQLSHVPGKGFLLGFDVFSQKTIRELLGLVNRKVEQRK